MYNGSNWHCMIPNGPNGPKTLPMGKLHVYMSCWTTLGTFQRPTGPLNGPKHHQDGSEYHQNGPSWPQMSIHDSNRPWNTSHGYIIWYYVMLDHPGAFSEAQWAPKWRKTAPKWPFVAQNGPVWPKMMLKWRAFMTQNVPAWPEMTLKHFSGHNTWLYYILDHPG